MTRVPQKQRRILAIAPSAWGVGFAVLEGPDTLVDWGVKTVKGDKNTRSVEKVKELIDHYHPEILALEDLSAGKSRRSARIRDLGERIMGLATSSGIQVAVFSLEQVRQAFSSNGQETKQARAEALAKRFPEELGFRLPPKRRLWESQDRRMDIFDAVALALMPGKRRRER